MTSHRKLRRHRTLCIQDITIQSLADKHVRKYTYIHVELQINAAMSLAHKYSKVSIYKLIFIPYLFFTMKAGAVDYAASYFKYKSPTPIIGAPINKTLKRLKQELRANASSVESDLGGGDHGYLGLVLTDAEYETVSNTPFTAPTYPTALTIPTGTDQVEALNLREKYKEERRTYLECKNVEKALQRHIQDAIEDKYLESLVDEDTQLIQDDIPDVLQYLFDTYGKIPSEEVKQREMEIRSMTFNPADPMILLFNPLEKLKKMAEAAQIAYTEEQILDMGLTVVRNTRDFEKALGDWESLAAARKTCSM
mgnify:CR=1 FL=1